MSVFDKFFERYSYKFPKGYPDFTNKQDILVLENIFNEIDLFEVSNLTKSELLKYKDRPEKDRISILIKKIQNNEELELVDGSTFIVDNKEEAIKNLQGEIPSTGVELINKDGQKIKTSKLRKTKEFGGKDAVSTDAKKPVVDTEVKESLVIVFYNILKEGGNLKPFDAGNYANNFKIIKSSTDKFNDVESSAQNKINQLFDLIGNTTTPLSKTRSVLNNPYSIALELYGDYPSARVNRGELFDTIRSTCSKITKLPADKWNPGDIYLVNSTPELPTETDSIVPWNELFVNEWGSTNAPLVSISLKEERYQPGRAKSYLEKFGEEVDYNMSKEEFEYTDDQYKKAIKKYRENIIDYFNNTQPVEKKGDGWENFPSDRKQLQTKYGAYKLLNLLAGKNDASLAGLFAFGLSIDKDARANPTFWKLIGKNNGSKASKIKYPAGVNTEMAEGEDIVILDNSTNGGFTISGILSKTDGDNTDTEPVKLSFRTTGPGQVQIV
jgi:hypothetical protein